MIDQDLVVKEIDGKSVIVDINKAKYYTFNETGNIILKYLIDNMEYDEIKNKFLENYDVSENNFSKDFKAFAVVLKDKNILL